MKFQYVSAVIFVKNIAAARGFYEGLLGMEVSTDHGSNVGYQGGLSIWQQEHATEVIFGAPLLDIPPRKAAAELYFETKDLAAACRRLDEAGVEWIHPVFEQPWGQRVARLYDPDGHIVEVAEPMDAPILRFLEQGLGVEEIARRTAMPIEIVRQVAAAWQPALPLVESK